METDKLISRAAAYCSAAEHCRQDVTNKLQAWGAESEDQIEQVIAYLEHERFLDENRYASAFANDKLRFQGWGRQKIRLGLIQKGVDSHAIHEALAGLDEEEITRTITRLALKYTDPQKRFRFLLSRGFTPAEISSALHSDY